MIPGIDEVWIYKKTGLPYKVISLCEIKTYKDPVRNGWTTGVAYVPVVVTETQKSLYVRELEELVTKFRNSGVQS